MVFQSFALFPWLTVYENVALGLEAQRLPRAEIRRPAPLAAIDLIGLDGFEIRLSEANCRAACASASALRAPWSCIPNILLMDEPFSALDVLTAETLRTDFLDLWSEGRMPIKGVILVTHNIEEAVLMCDRVLVFSSNPGRVATELAVPFAHPRNRLDPAFRQMVDDIYAVMTRRAVVPAATAPSQTQSAPVDATFGSALHPVSTNLLSGLAESLAGPPYNGRADLPALAEALQLEADELLPLGESLAQLGFAVLEEGDLRLTDAGRAFAVADIEPRKELFAAGLRQHVPLVAAIRRTLDERHNHRAAYVRFLDELEDHMSPEYATETMRTAIAWGRYAELFSYDEEAQAFFLDEDEEEEEPAPAE